MARCRTALPAAATVRITAARMASLSRTVDRDELERLLPSWHEVHAFRRGNSSPPAPAAEDESEFVDADDELAVAVGSAMADIINPERSDSATETKTRYLYGGKHVTEEDVRVAVRYWWHRLENVTDEPRICEDLLRLELKVHTISDCNGTALNYSAPQGHYGGRRQAISKAAAAGIAASKPLRGQERSTAVLNLGGASMLVEMAEPAVTVVEARSASQRVARINFVKNKINSRRLHYQVRH